MSNSAFAGALPAVIVIISAASCSRSVTEPAPNRRNQGAHDELQGVQCQTSECSRGAAAAPQQPQPKGQEAGTKGQEQQPKETEAGTKVGKEAGPKGGKEAGPKGGKEAGPKAEDAGSMAHDACATPGSDAASSVCPNPLRGVPNTFGFASPTGTLINHCIATHEPNCLALHAPSDVALDYGNFPFSRDVPGQYFYAVVAEGHEDGGFLDGAVGNLSDSTPSAVDGDHGSGDAVGDRTLVIADPVVSLLFPSSKGSHPISFPPSQFMLIHLAPFDTTPENRYVLAICPTTAMSRCDCAFERFQLEPLAKDAGAAPDAMCPDM